MMEFFSQIVELPWEHYAINRLIVVNRIRIHTGQFWKRIRNLAKCVYLHMTCQGKKT